MYSRIVKPVTDTQRTPSEGHPFGDWLLPLTLLAVALLGVIWPRVWIVAPAVLLLAGLEVARLLLAANHLSKQKQASRRLANMVASAPWGMHLYQRHRDGRLVLVGANPAADRILGIDHRELVGKTIEEAFPPLALTEVPERYRKTAALGEEWSTEEIAYEEGRIKGAFEVHAFQTTPGEMAATFVDISERKQWEADRDRLLREAQEANQAKDQFLAVLSHELRNPLAAIRASVELLRRSGATCAEAPVRRAIEVIDRNERLQARLVNDLIDLSRLSQGKTNLQRAPVELEAVVRSTMEAFHDDAVRAGLTLEMQAASGLWVNGDVDRLQQIVMNLVSNALKFTLPGGKVTVELERVNGNGRVTVADTGIGIETSRMSGLFEMFKQGQIGGQRARGLGVGLALVASFTRLHGGRVWSESDGPGHGTRFCVELPLIEAPPPVAAVESPRTKNASLRVLVLEDNPDTRTMLTEALSLCSYDVLSAESGEAALALLAHESVDAILADIGLPGMDGYEFMHQARLLPGLAQVPALAVTGYGQDGDVRRAHEAGFTGHFIKPVDIDVLDQRLRKTLHRQPSKA